MNTSEDFTTLVQALTQLILSHHKRTRLPQGPEDPLPTFLAEIETYLIRIIQPFYPSEETHLCSHHNAKNWTTATIKTLKEHYLRLQDKNIEIIKSLLVMDWDRALLVAIRRARQHTPQIKEEAIETTRNILRDIMEPSFPIKSKENTEPRRKNTEKWETIPRNTFQGETPHNTPLNTNSPTRTTETPLHARRQTLEDGSPTTPPPEPMEENTETITWSNHHNPCITPHIPITPEITVINTTPKLPQLRPLNPTRKLTTEPNHSTTRKRSREEEKCDTEIPNSRPTKTPPGLPLYTHHPHLGDKYHNWFLDPQREIIILGDSNISRLPRIYDPRIQVDSFPGAKITHGVHLIKNKTPLSPQVKKVILSFGINDMHTTNPSLIRKTLGSLYNASYTTFPNATIRIPLINYDSNLPAKMQENLAQINELLKTFNSFIPRMEKSKFNTTTDLIHWTTETANNIWQHWKIFLG